MVVLGGLAVTALILFTPWLAPLFQFEVRPLADARLPVGAGCYADVARHRWVLFNTWFMERFLRLEGAEG